MTNHKKTYPKLIVSGLIFFFFLSISSFITDTAYSQHELRAGVAKVDITNNTPRVMVNGRISEGVQSRLMSRILVLNDGEHPLIIVTSDLNCHDVITPVLRERLEDELGIKPSQLILLVTHNHSSPIQINPANFDYGHRVANDIFDGIVEAMNNERGPVTVHFGVGQDYLLSSVGNSPVDHDLQVLKVMDGDDPIAIYLNHGTHPLQNTRNRVDSGHPGFVMDFIEEAIPGVMAMYGTSGVGSQFTYNWREVEAKTSRYMEEGKSIADIDQMLEEESRSFARRVADLTLKVVNDELTDVTGPLSSRFEVIPLPLAEPISLEEALELAESFPDDVGFVHYPHEHRGTNWVRMLLRYYEKGLPFPTQTTDMVGTYDTYLINLEDTELLEKYSYSIHDKHPNFFEEVIVAQIGPMPFVALQGEVAAPIIMRIKDSFRAKMPIMVSSIFGTHNLYIPTRELVRLDVYQPRTLRIQYGSPVDWDPSVEDVMVNAVIRMVNESLNN